MTRLRAARAGQYPVMKPLACLLALWVLPVSASVAAEGGSQPNVLLLFSADQRADTLGALGNADIRTPALDGLTQQGTAFTRAYCMGSHHGAVCAVAGDAAERAHTFSCE